MNIIKGGLPIGSVGVLATILLMMNSAFADPNVSLVCKDTIPAGSTVKWYYTKAPGHSDEPSIHLEVNLSNLTENHPPPGIQLMITKKNGHALVIFAVMPKAIPGHDFSYHVDTDSYTGPLLRSDQTYKRKLDIYIIVGGSGYHGTLDYSECVNSTAVSVPLAAAAMIPDFSGKTPLNTVRNEWLRVSMEPTAAMRQESDHPVARTSPHEKLRRLGSEMSG